VAADPSSVGASSVPGDRVGDEAPVGPGPGVRWTGDGSLAPRRAPRWGADGTSSTLDPSTAPRPAASREPMVDGMVLASAGRRLTGFFLDHLIKSVLIGIVIVIAGIEVTDWWALPMEVVVASAILNIGYAFVFGIAGVTPGARMLGIRVVATTGEDPGMRRSLVRAAVGSLNEMVFYAGSLWMLFDARRQTMMDRVAGTLVVRAASTRR